MSTAPTASAIASRVLAAKLPCVPGDYLVTVRATSGALVHYAPHLIRIVDQLPPPLPTPTFSLASIRGGIPTTGIVALAGPAPTGGAVVSLLNDSPAVAMVPASVIIPAVRRARRSA